MYYNNEVITLKTWSKRNTLPTNDSKLYFSDGMHPSELTYKVWGKETGLFIKSKIRK
jgi:lysophospholipase L1-like esterase